jgi:hypothetical protein
MCVCDLINMCYWSRCIRYIMIFVDNYYYCLLTCEDCVNSSARNELKKHMMIKLKNVLMNSGSTFCARILGTHLKNTCFSLGERRKEFRMTATVPTSKKKNQAQLL